MGNLLVDDLAEDSISQRPEVKQVSLGDLTKLAEEYLALEVELGKLETRMETTKAAMDLIANVKLPEAMQSIRQVSFSLQDGTVIEIQDKIHASIKEENRAAAHEWLRNNDFGGLIKNNVTVTFGKGEDAEAERLVEMVEGLQRAGELHAGSVDRKEQVHPSTLTSFVKEQLKKGKNIPLDVFGVHIAQVAKLQQPKRK